MAFFRFVGDPNDDGSGPNEVMWGDYAFGRLEWTEVPDDACAKLRGNSHFEERGLVDGEAPVKRPRGRPRLVREGEAA